MQSFYQFSFDIPVHQLVIGFLGFFVSAYIAANEMGSYLLLMQSSYGFVDYFDRRSAALSIVTLNGRHL